MLQLLPLAGIAEAKRPVHGNAIGAHRRHPSHEVEPRVGVLLPHLTESTHNRIPVLSLPVLADKQETGRIPFPVSPRHDMVRADADYVNLPFLESVVLDGRRCRPMTHKAAAASAAGHAALHVDSSP